MSPGTHSTIAAGQRLRAALTDTQIQSLLGVVTEAGFLAGLDDRLRAADPDLADTIRRLLAAVPAAQSRVTPSDQKARETWDDLWGKWQDCVSELGDEHGAYANHEEHWHPPYFDPYALSDDLEKAAGPMLEWIERAFPLVQKPDLFDEAFAEMERGIASYPDWVQMNEECCSLGPQATACVLRWIWCGLANKPTPGVRLVDRLRAMEVEHENVRLNAEALFDFLANLSEECCRAIHAHLREPAFADAVADTRSLWHRIQCEYDKRFDSPAFLRTCEQHLSVNWRYGEPLISDARSRGNFAQAERFVELTLASLLRLAPDEPWHPEDCLLPENPYCHPEGEDVALLTLLEQWESIATARRKPARVASCRLQRALLKSPEHWTAVLKAFDEFQHDGGSRAAADRLFAEWRERMVKACAQHEEAKLPAKDSWVYWLIQARRDPVAQKDAFFEHADLWLECCQEHAAFFAKYWRSLALFTHSLPAYERLKEECPAFHSHALAPASNVSPGLAASIREALEFLGETAARLDPMRVWRKHLHTLVSVPGQNGSYYRDQALWMKALSEVNRAGYDKLLAEWKVEFRRRRNLWAEMAAVKCPEC